MFKNNFGPKGLLNAFRRRRRLDFLIDRINVPTLVQHTDPLMTKTILEMVDIKSSIADVKSNICYGMTQQ
jgi:hypothetical protein